MRNYRLIAMLIALSFLVFSMLACALSPTTQISSFQPEKWAQLSEGMSREQVFTLLGPPLSWKKIGHMWTVYYRFGSLRLWTYEDTALLDEWWRCYSYSNTTLCPYSMGTRDRGNVGNIEGGTLGYDDRVEIYKKNNE